MTVAEIVNRRGNARENLLQILHDIQDASGDNSLHKETIDELSVIMDISVSDIVGTATFYTMFSLKPRGRHLVRLCESPPCWLMGSDTILEVLVRKLGIGFGGTTKDGMFTLEPTSCLGVCGVAPAMMVDDVVYGNLTERKIEEILEGFSDTARKPQKPIAKTKTSPIKPAATPKTGKPKATIPARKKSAAKT